MFETKAALQLLAGEGHGGILNLDDDADTDPPICSVREVLRFKYLTAQPLHLNCLLPNWADLPATHPVIFDPLYGRVIVQKLCGLPVLLVPLVWMFMVTDDFVPHFTWCQVSCVLLLPYLLNRFVPPTVCFLRDSFAFCDVLTDCIA